MYTNCDFKHCALIRRALSCLSQEGQFKALYEGPKGEEAAAQSPPTDDLAEVGIILIGWMRANQPAAYRVLQ